MGNEATAAANVVLNLGEEDTLSCLIIYRAIYLWGTQREP